MKADNTFLLTISSINCRQYGKRSLTGAARHNKRTLMHSDDDPIDGSRTHLNRSLLDLPDTPEGVVDLATRLMADRGFNPGRADACIAAEAMFSLRDEPEGFDMFEYFSESSSWVAERLGGQLLSADVHRDQSHPHCHALVLLPLAIGGPSGSKLIEFKHESSRRLQAFFDEVASKYGLRMPPPSLSASDKKMLARQVHERMYATADPATHSVLWPRFSNCVNRDPRGFAVDLGITMRAGTTLTNLAQTPGAGPRTAAAESAGNQRLQAAWGDGGRTQHEAAALVTTPKGVASFLSNDHPLSESQSAAPRDPPPEQHPSRVGVASFLSSDPASPVSSCNTGRPTEVPGDHLQTPPEPLLSTRVPSADLDEIVYVVEHEDWPVEEWDGTIGEHRPRPLRPTQAQRAEAAAWVNSMLQRRPVMV